MKNFFLYKNIKQDLNLILSLYIYIFKIFDFVDGYF